MSRKRKNGELSADDRILWSQVARSVKPMHDRFLTEARETPEEVQSHRHGAPSLVNPVLHPPYQAPASKPKKRDPAAAIDVPTRRKLAKGRVAIDRTIDLHDLDQAEAHGRLLAFLYQAHASGSRHVLVITGRGASLGSAGILRRAVPQWLETEPFRGLVSGFHGAARHHGGTGAIYVRLRRREG